MAESKKKQRKMSVRHWSKTETYEELKAIAYKFPMDRPPGENWAIMERMRQLRYGYKPGEHKMDKSVIRTLTMEELRKETEQEYVEDIRKYGPR